MVDHEQTDEQHEQMPVDPAKHFRDAICRLTRMMPAPVSATTSRAQSVNTNATTITSVMKAPFTACQGSNAGESASTGGIALCHLPR